MVTETIKAEKSKGEIVIETQTAFETDLDRIEAKMKELTNKKDLKGLEKSAGEILVGFLKFYGGGDFVKSNQLEK